MPNDSMELLLELGTKILDYSRSITKHGWSINPSIQVLVNPEARCPSCNAWVQTNRIWFVDEEDRKLRGCWEVTPGAMHKGMTAYDDTHPHSTGPTGDICVGSNGSTIEALFSGISPGTHYASTERWFWHLGHDCPAYPPDVECSICKRMHPRIVTYQYGAGLRLCGRECYQVACMFRCVKCSGPRDFYEPTDRERHCTTCFEEESVTCSYCNARVMNYRSGMVAETTDIVCRRCIRSRCRYCDDCSRIWRLGDLRGPMCKLCRPNLYESAPPPSPDLIAFEAEEESEEESEPQFTCVNCTNRVSWNGRYCGDCCCEICVRARNDRSRRGGEDDDEEQEADEEDPLDYQEPDDDDGDDDGDDNLAHLGLGEEEEEDD